MSQANAPAKSGGWMKAVFGALAGVLGGGVAMYVTPLVDRVVKPQKPLANFAVEASGLQVTFRNRSTGGEGFWDFGDGSALEPSGAAGQDVTHKYAKPGNFTAKLTLRSYFGEESERAVPVEVKAEDVGPPQITSFEIIPVCGQTYAPATFRLVSKAKNADVCVWDLGNERPLEISSDSPEQQEKIVTFATPGKYLVQLAVINGGKQADRKTVPIEVQAAPASALMAVVRVLDSGTRVRAIASVDKIPLTPEAKPTTFARELAARAGHKFVEAKLAAPAVDGARNIVVTLNADQSRAKVTGELLAASASAKGGPVVVVPVALRQEARSADARPQSVMTVALKVPGATAVSLPPLPRDWTTPKRQAVIDLSSGGQRVGTTIAVPSTTSVAWQNRRYQVVASFVGEQMQVVVTELKGIASAK